MFLMQNYCFSLICKRIVSKLWKNHTKTNRLFSDVNNLLVVWGVKCPEGFI